MEEIQTGSFNKTRKPFDGNILKIVHLVAVIAFVITVTAITAYFIQSAKYSPPKISYNLPPNLTPNQKALYFANINQYQAAMQIYKQQLASANNSSSKSNIYFMMSALALRFKDYTNARLYANESKLLDPKSPSPYVSLAQLATSAGNISAAKQYWQEAINNLSPSQPGYNLIKEDYQNSMAKLQ